MCVEIDDTDDSVVHNEIYKYMIMQMIMHFWHVKYHCNTLSVLNPNRSVDELTTFYILRWVNNVFHILLKIWHIIVWFGPNCLGKSTPSFRIYDMINKICRNVFLTMRL